MLSTDREQFDVQLAMLCAGFNVPIGERSNAYWTGLAKMELATFARVVAHSLGESGPEKIPTPGQCWKISKELRIQRHVPREPSAPKFAGDRWDIAANRHLLEQVRRHPKRYAPDTSYDPKLRQVVPGPLTRAYTAIVVHWKNAWVEDMRADDKGEGVSIEAQQRAWEDCMARADEQIRLSQVEAA